MLRERFELEADALWAHLRRLARQAPRLEGLYARDADPRVARLVQSAAFAFSAAHNRLNDDGQALVRPLVARALPESLRPRPSSTILELSASSGRCGSVRDASFAARVGQARIPFQVAWPATLAPMALEDVVLDRLDARRQVLRFALVGRSGMSLGAALPDAVRLFVHLEPRGVALDLVHALHASRDAGRMKLFDWKKELIADRELPDGAVSWVRVDTDEAALVSARADRFRSSSLLRDLFAFPESFCFFDLRLGEGREQRAERLEVTLPLRHIVNGASLLSGDHLRLFCAPATNQFVSAIEPVPHTGASEAVLAVAGRPHAEILEVRGLATTSIRNADRKPLRSWEAPDTPNPFDAGGIYFALEQRAAAHDGRTELRALFGRLDAFPAAPGAVVEGNVLACDGMLTSTVGLGEIGSPREGATNISRVTPSRRALLGRNHAWRMSAYARMPPAHLAERARLTEFLELHDPFGMQDMATRVARPRLLTSKHVREHELIDGVLGWGDRFVVDSDAGGCSDGELWLVGALLHRAIAERGEALRFSRLVLQRGGALFADYGARPGARLPFPLG
jgi:type VI protein secretion system component VasA